MPQIGPPFTGITVGTNEAAVLCVGQFYHPQRPHFFHLDFTASLASPHVDTHWNNSALSDALVAARGNCSHRVTQASVWWCFHSGANLVYVHSSQYSTVCAQSSLVWHVHLIWGRCSSRFNLRLFEARNSLLICTAEFLGILGNMSRKWECST